MNRKFSDTIRACVSMTLAMLPLSLDLLPKEELVENFLQKLLTYTVTVC